MNLLYALILLTTTSMVSLASVPDTVQQDMRVQHARELMGKHYKKSVVSSLEKQTDVEEKIKEMVKTFLPKKYKEQSEAMANSIIHESNKHKLDPYFVMAIISGESSFNPDARGSVGEIGLMQIRPSTGRWMAEIIGMKWSGKRTLNDPIKNIVIGTAYIAWLRDKFEGHGRLYLAAYNMGPKSVKQAVRKKIWPKDYPRHVMKRYMAFYEEN